MSKKKKPKMEFRFYQIPSGEPCIALLGKKWIQNYGRNIDYLHFHNYMEIGVCYEGTGQLVLGEEDCRFRDNQFSIIPKNYPHTTNSDRDTISRWEYLFIDVENILGAVYLSNPSMAQKISERVNSRAILAGTEEYPQIAEKIFQIIEAMRKGEEFYQDEVTGLLWALFMEIARINRKEGKESPAEVGRARMLLISEALDYISKHCENPIRIEELAEKCHISEAHFRRNFSACMNMSPVEYINLVRVKHACEYLKKTGDSISDIAHKSGFPTSSTFNRNFKKIMGVSPKEWRNLPENYERQLLGFNIHSENGW